MINALQLTTCDQEPIHLLSKIQQSGVMFVLDIDDLSILQVSDNCSKLINKIPSDILETPFALYFPKSIIKKIIDIVEAKNITSKAQIFFDDLNKKRLFFAIHIEKHYIIVEISDVTSNQNNIKSLETKENMIKKSVAHCENILNFIELVTEIAKSVKEISGFDRVLIYKFDKDNNGTVLAEEYENFDESLLGHRFPASDIPVQARSLYVNNRFRIIENAGETNAILVPTINSRTNTPLDMSMCYLRSVSPIHIEYLKNMGVMASMSISIVINGKLWGLIACHNKTPKKIPLSAYEIYYLLSSIFSSQIQQKEVLEQYKLSSTLQLKRELFITSLNQYSDNSFDEALNFEIDNLTKLINCDEAIIVNEGHNISKKSNLRDDEILRLLAIVKEQKKKDIFDCSNLGILYPEVLSFSNKIGGMLALNFPNYKNIWILFLKYEQIHSVFWAGNPSKQVEFKNGIMVINPRASFESWKEDVVGSSSVFLDEEISSAQLLTKKLESTIKLFQKYEEAKKIKEEKLAQEAKFQEQKLASISEVIANIAHQWRQPLSVITTLASAIQIRQEYRNLTDEILSDNMKKIMIHSEYLSKTIDDFRHFMQNTTELSKISIVSIIKKALNLYDTVFQNNNIEVYSILEDDIIINGNENELITAFMNLFNNAIDAVSQNEQKIIYITSTTINKKLIVEICDNGCGITTEIADKLFEPYFTTKHKSVGTGLGLSIAYKTFHTNHNAFLKATNKEFIVNNNNYFGACLTIQFDENKSIAE